jgi:hypothetical protein
MDIISNNECSYDNYYSYVMQNRSSNLNGIWFDGENVSPVIKRTINQL